MRADEPTEREQELLVAAQLVVDEWFALSPRPPFAAALLSAERHQLPLLQLTDHERPLFHAVANAIRVGRGHALTKARPLLKLLRTGLDA